MRRLILVAALVLLIAVAYRGLGSEQTGTGTLTVSQPWPSPGEEAPNFEAELLSDEEFAMSDEGTYVISFWNGLHQGSQSSRPAFERLAREYEGREVSFAAVYLGNVPRTDRQDAPYAVMQDSSGELASRYNVKRVPRLFLIDDGEVRLSLNSFYPEDRRELRRMLEEMTRTDA